MKSDKKGSCGKQPRVGKVGDKKPARGLGRGRQSNVKRGR